MSLFRMHDVDGGGMFPVSAEDAPRWNQQGYGIFQSVNVFSGARRIENCVRVRAWAIEFDQGGKAEQRKRILATPLIPSAVVESKRGYHVWWFATNARKEFYRPLVSRMVKAFGADESVRDITRVLRQPGFLHQKDPANPFLCRIAYGSTPPRRYAERIMFRYFPPEKTEALRQHEAVRREYVTPSGDNFFDRVYNLDQGEALRRLSGTGYVGGEEYFLKPQWNGKQNIFVNGKSTACWIDVEGRIGSHANGGPTVLQWLAYFGMPKREAVAVVKKLFPGLEKP